MLIGDSADGNCQEGLEVDGTSGLWTFFNDGGTTTMMSGAEVGANGKTAYERIKGKVAKIDGLEFGDGVLWKRRREGGPLGKLTCMWENGIYLGMKGTTGEIIVGNKAGIWRTR